MTTSIENSFRNLTQSELIDIQDHCDLNYGIELKTINSNNSKDGYTNCTINTILRYYKNLCTFVTTYIGSNTHVQIRNIEKEPNTINILPKTGYVPNLVNKMLVTAYKMYKQPGKNLEHINEAIEYHNNLVEYYVPKNALYLKGNVSIEKNKKELEIFCKDTKTLYIVICKNIDNKYDNTSAFFTEVNDVVTNNLKSYNNKKVPISLMLSQYAKNIWYVDKRTHGKEDTFVKGFYSSIRENNPNKTLINLFKSIPVEPYIRGLKNFQYLVSIFTNKEPDTGLKETDIPKIFPNVQIVTIIQTDKSSD